MREHGGLLLAGGRGDLLAHRLLLGAQPLEVAERRAPARVEVEGGVDEGGVGTARLLAGTDDVGGVPKDAQVDHLPRVSTRPARGSHAGSTVGT